MKVFYSGVISSFGIIGRCPDVCWFSVRITEGSNRTEKKKNKHAQNLQMPGVTGFPRHVAIQRCPMKLPLEVQVVRPRF